mmetsp:Transcript_28990/g.64964  ORF Transcript_28990/g.64964 Transcript_28990/m.64964 type:complete len:94 (+) Transcript_28990:1468-1749(+)
MPDAPSVVLLIEQESTDVSLLRLGAIPASTQLTFLRLLPPVRLSGCRIDSIDYREMLCNWCALAMPGGRGWASLSPSLTGLLAQAADDVSRLL